MIRTARAVINFDALRHNFQRVKHYAPNSKIMAVIKANAYGHGMLNVARHLNEADGYAVACFDEAVVLRKAGIEQPITVLQGFKNKFELQKMIFLRLMPVIHQAWQIELLEHYKQSGALKVWLKINTGMGRLGFAVDQAEHCLQQLNACGVIDQVLLLSHFANADDAAHPLNQQQIDIFKQLTSSFGLEASMANSAGLIQFNDVQMDWVRPGIMLYGSSPLHRQSAAELGLKSVMQLSSSLIAINKMSKGDTVGYGSQWQCPENMPVGIVGIGYGDGYPRHAQQGTPVWLKGVTVPIIGRVSMDMVCVDLRAVVEAKCGDEVVLWGDPLSVDEIAGHAGTISYELLCNMKDCVVS